MTEPSVNDTAKRGPLRRFVNRLEVDRAVFYAICLRVWQLFAGAVSVVLIGTYFSPDLQGYYYTFASLMALQTFFELGLSIVVINVSSHEWAHLRLDSEGRIEGDSDALSRLVSLGRLLFRWYAIAATMFVVLAGLGGAWFISQKDYAEIAWQPPWTALIVLTGGLLWTLPFNALLEGCGQIIVVSRFRFLQGVVANLAVWTTMLLGGGLWAAAAATGARLAVDLVLLLVRYRRFFEPFFRPPTGPLLHWRHELWPMQWRLAVMGVFAFFATNLFTPVMFHFHDPATAGRMGMSWQLFFMLQMGALAWVQARAPLFGRLLAREDHAELERVFFRLTAISQVVVILGAAAIWFGTWLLGYLDIWLASRLLDPLTTGLFLLAVVLYHFPQCQTFYIRAHKRELLLGMSTISATLIGLSVWWFGKTYGPTGAAAAYLVVIAFVILPWETTIWLRCRKEHQIGHSANDQ
jgi:hypothetical protein